jgi:hypothetical protein
MSALSIQPTYPTFTDIDGQPLESGFVWLGTANLDPQVNPINVYWDAALTIPAPQPIRTLGGYPSNSGTPARLYVNSDYSIRVMNKNGSVVYSAAEATERYSDVVVSGVNASEVAYDPAGTGAVATTVQAKLRESVSVKDFGATPSASAAENNAAFNAAVTAASLVSGSVYIPAGTYTLSVPLALPGDVSLHGDGMGSILYFTDCNGLILGPDSSSYENIGTSRFIRDFQLWGNNATTSIYDAITCNYSATSGLRLTGTTFDNVTVKDFKTGAFLRGLWNSAFNNCNFINVFYGIYFNGQSIKNVINNCFFQNYSQPDANSWGITTVSVDGESTQSVQITSTQTYAFDIGIRIALGFEVQIEHCDISACQSIGVSINTTQGGVYVRDSWIQTNNTGQTYGVYIAGLASPNYNDIHIVGNHIQCDAPFLGSTGIYMAAAQVGVYACDNMINNFDIGIENLAVPFAIIKHNRINILTSAYSSASKTILINSSSVDNEVGPNYVIRGDTVQNAAWRQATTMTVASANINVTDSTKFPVGKEVEFASTNNGFYTDVLYYVLTSSANVITVAANSTGAAIASTGTAANFVFASPRQLQYNTAACPSGILFFGNGSFMGTLNGMTATTVNGKVDWAASGKIMTLTPSTSGTWTGTSATTAMALIGMPDLILNPVATQKVVCNAIDNGANSFSVATISTAGAITFAVGAGSAVFTNSGTKGLAVNAPIMYQLS